MNSEHFQNSNYSERERLPVLRKQLLDAIEQNKTQATPLYQIGECERLEFSYQPDFSTEIKIEVANIGSATRPIRIKLETIQNKWIQKCTWSIKEVSSIRHYLIHDCWTVRQWEEGSNFLHHDNSNVILEEILDHIIGAWEFNRFSAEGSMYLHEVEYLLQKASINAT